MLVTALTPRIGYDEAARVEHEAQATGRSLREVVLAHRLMDAAEVDRVLEPLAMTRPADPRPHASTSAEEVMENEGGHFVEAVPAAPSFRLVRH